MSVSDFSGGLQASIYRKNVLVYGPVDVDVQTIILHNRSNSTVDSMASDSRNSVPGNTSQLTHTLFFDMVAADVYKPFLEDRVIVSGGNAQFDGDFIVKQYPGPQWGLGSDIDCFELSCRYVGAKKPGDTDADDNTGNVRFGPRRAGGDS